MRQFATVLLSIIAISYCSSQSISIKDLENTLGKDKANFIEMIEAKGFKPGLAELETIAKNLARNVSNMTGEKFIGRSFMHSSNYTATIIYNEKGIASMLQFGTKRPKNEDVKKLISTLESFKYVITRDSDSADGSSNIKAYSKGDKVFSLASYYNGGYTLTSYLSSLE